MAKTKAKSTAKKTRRSPLQTAYSNLRKKKSQHCAGKATKTALNDAVKTYVDRAVKAGQTKSDATAKANRVVRSKCTVTK